MGTELYYTAEVRINGTLVSTGNGQNKKSAKKEANMHALQNVAPKLYNEWINKN